MGVNGKVVIVTGASEQGRNATAGMRPADSAEYVAGKILFAVQTEEAEVFW